MNYASPSRDELRQRYLAGADLGGWLEFALINTCRYDDDELGSSLATAVSILQPENGLAKVVCAYYAWEGLDFDSFDLHLIAMQSVIETRTQVGAAALMIDRLVERKSEFSESTGEPSNHDIEALRLSVDAEPQWVENHARLSLALDQSGHKLAAAAHLDAAISNVLKPEESISITEFERAYHWAFTGRLSDGADLKDRKLRLD